MVRVRNELNQVIIQDENSKEIGRISFPEIGENRVHINKIVIDEDQRHQGYADLLMQEAMKRLKKDGKTAYVTCAYAKQWLTEHEEYKHLVWKM